MMNQMMNKLFLETSLEYFSNHSAVLIELSMSAETVLNGWQSFCNTVLLKKMELELCGHFCRANNRLISLKLLWNLPNYLLQNNMKNICYKYNIPIRNICCPKHSNEIKAFKTQETPNIQIEYLLIVSLLFESYHEEYNHVQQQSYHYLEDYEMEKFHEWKYLYRRYFDSKQLSSINSESMYRTTLRSAQYNGFIIIQPTSSWYCLIIQTIEWQLFIVDLKNFIIKINNCIFNVSLSYMYVLCIEAKFVKNSCHPDPYSDL
ncbi:hypothetical protein AGLY_007708 [Aphis glycines]|uniref:Uncharacterized protein n=1 Tax=Aphis glycines TaxID=307491 RepID=A0A6G0TNC0_APHGL|nr:hypothetical protein AGLY_007708 [Aphis glycines]